MKNISLLRDKTRTLFLWLFDEGNNQGNVAAIIFIVAAAILFCLPLFHSINNVSLDEAWLQFFSYHSFLRQGLIRFSQLPLWSPYFGGGYPFVGHPESPLLSPFSLITLLLGEVLGLKLIILFSYIAAGWGMFYLTRHILRYNLAGAIFSSFIFFLNSNLPYQVSTGDLCEVNLFYLPLILAFFLKAKERGYYSIFCAALFAVLITNGAGLCIITLSLFLILFSFINAFQIERRKIKISLGYLKVFFTVIILSFLLAAVRILPAVKLLSINDRGYDNYLDAAEGSLTLKNFFYSIFPRAIYAGSNDCFPGTDSVVGSTMYFGYFPLLLCLLAFFIFRKELVRYFILLLIFIMLCFGKNSPLDLFKLLWHIPFFHSLHYPNKYFAFFCVFIISLVSGKAFLVFKRYKRYASLSVFFAIMIISINAVHLFFVNRVYHKGLFAEERPKYVYENSFFHVNSITANPAVKDEYRYHRDGEKNAFLQYICVLKNIGLINWHGNIYLGEYAVPKYLVDLKTNRWHLNPAYRGEAFFLRNSANQARIRYFSPNKLSLDCLINDPDKLVINQNYDNDWRSKNGAVGSCNGLLSMDLQKKGRYVVELSYVPVLFYAGLVISSATLIAAILFIIKKR